MAVTYIKAFERLSKNVVPSNYNLKLVPDLEKFTFTGTVDINIEIVQETEKIELNCIDIDIKSALFAGESTFPSSEIKYDKEEEKANIHFAVKLPIGKACLKMEFTGELNDKMKGFYRSKYTNNAGEEKYLAVTQFEATDARRAFPCWDEPAIKATFDITLDVPKHLTTLSNMEELSTEPSDRDGCHVIKYARTPIMSTYLVAFVIGEFDHVSGKTDEGIKVRVYTPLGKSVQGEFALEISLKTLPFYHKYFGIPYALPKLDLIAIPDFSAGAMENWGLVTYRETALLVDAKESSAMAKQWVALVVGHEIAHQWFGNLTTMEWWTHLWLNEGFASWIEYLCVDHCCPDYDIWTQFAVNDYGRGLNLDALRNSHAIEVPVKNPAEIDEIFDSISYSKGASVIRMLHSYIGDEAFKKGLNHYLTAFKFKNAFTEDLWNSLGLASGKPVDKVMTTWTSQMGFPVLSVSQEQVGDKKKLKFSQRRFVADGSEEEEDSNYKWLIPISISTSSSPTKTVLSTLVEGSEMEVSIDSKPEGWCKVNLGHVGFFRTKYSPEMLNALIPALKNQELQPRDRLGVENDIFACAVAGLMKTADFFDILTGYTAEDNYTVWSDINLNLSSISTVMQYTPVFNEFQKFVLSVMKPVAQKVGWCAQESEGHSVALLRALLIGKLGRLGDPDTVKECQTRFEKHISGSEQIPADLRAAVYGTVIANGNMRTLEQLMDLHKATTHMEEKDRILRCMGGNNSEELIKRVLKFSLSSEVKSQDTVFCIAGCTRSMVGRKLAWQFLKDEWNTLSERYAGGFLINRLISSVCSDFATVEMAAEIKAFFDANPAPAGARTIKQSIESINLNARWLRRDEENIKNWLTARQ